jgi:hypothetical protein
VRARRRRPLVGQNLEGIAVDRVVEDQENPTDDRTGDHQPRQRQRRVRGERAREHRYREDPEQPGDDRSQMHRQPGGTVRNVLQGGHVRDVRWQIAVAAERNGKDERPGDGTDAADAQKQHLFARERGMSPRSRLVCLVSKHHAAAPVTIT